MNLLEPILKWNVADLGLDIRPTHGIIWNMANAPNRPRNSRTANGLKRGVRAEWDTPTPKRKPEPKFDPIAFLNECIKDKEAYSDKERKAFRKVIEHIEEIILENESMREAEWDRDIGMGAWGRFIEENR